MLVVYLSPDLELHNMFFVPTFQHNLLSVYRLCEQFDCLIIFSKLGCALQIPSIKRDLVFGDANVGLYVLRNNTLKKDTTSHDHPVSLKSSPLSRMFHVQCLFFQGLCAIVL